MAYTRVTNTRNGASAIRYAFEEPTHKEGMDRVLMASGSNLDTRFAMMQMKATWDAHGKNDGKTVQMYRIIQSFGLDELNPNNPEDIERANAIGLEFAAEMYPDKQALIVTQADGDGGKLHNHVLVNSVGFVDGKSLRGNRKEWIDISEATNDVMRRHGFNPPPLPKGRRDKETIAERKLADKGEYVWKHDLKARIRDGVSVEGVTDRESFIRHMADVHGVGVRYRGNDKDLSDGKTKMDGVSYDFVDANGRKRTSRANKLGSDFQSVALQEHFDKNIELAQAAPEPSGFDFGFDLGAELNKMVGGRTAKPSKPTAYKESPIQKEVRLEREKAQLEAEEAEQARRDAEYLAEIAQQEALERQKAEVERRKADQVRQVKEEQERERKQQERARLRQIQIAEERQRHIERNRMMARISHVAMPNEKISDEMIDMFKDLDAELDGKKHPISGRSYSDFDKLHTAKMRIHEQKQAERRGIQQAVTEHNTPEL